MITMTREDQIAALDTAPQIPDAKPCEQGAPSATENAFRAGLLDAGLPVPDGLIDGQGRGAGRRYAVYRNNIAVSLREALETGFPAVKKLIGEENFSRAAALYLRSEPPSSPLMMHYGAGFPAFLAGLEPLAHIGYLADVARLELALRESYHAADAPAFDPARLQGLEDEALEQARFVLAPSVRLIRSNWPLAQIYRYTMMADQPKPQAVAEDVLITRPDFDPMPQALPAGGGAFVAALLESARFGVALEAAGEGFDLAAMLGLLLQSGALTDVI